MDKSLLKRLLLVLPEKIGAPNLVSTAATNSCWLLTVNAPVFVQPLLFVQLATTLVLVGKGSTEGSLLTSVVVLEGVVLAGAEDFLLPQAVIRRPTKNTIKPRVIVRFIIHLT